MSCVEKAMMCSKIQYVRLDVHYFKNSIVPLQSASVGFEHYIT